MTNGEIAAAIAVKINEVEDTLEEIETLATDEFRDALPPMRRGIAEALLAQARAAVNLAHKAMHRCAQDSDDPSIQSGGGGGK